MEKYLKSGKPNREHRQVSHQGVTGTVLLTGQERNDILLFGVMKMPRQAREKSQTGVYHVMVRGINRQDIFQDEEDKKVYLERLTRYKKECGFEIYAYCLMNNHVHLVIKEGKDTLPEVMKKIGASYVYWYNWKYDRVGHLFQDRYKSEVVENDAYLLTVVRYVHQNPVKVGRSIDEWTSYKDYLDSSNLTDVTFIIDMFGKNESAKQSFIEFVNERNEDACLEIDTQKRLTDEDAKAIIKEVGRVSNCQELQCLEKLIRDEMLKNLKDNGLSIRQIERLTGINRGAILNA